MQATIFTILTNKRARNLASIKKILDKELSAGIPWYNKKMDIPNKSH